MLPDIAVIILNWNGWKDTIECLESVFRSEHVNYQVIVCDNCSEDHSLEKIKKWADGELTEPYKKFPTHKTDQQVEKPIQYKEYFWDSDCGFSDVQKKIPLILIHTGGNLGFAGGNNVGIRFALKEKNIKYVWLLNNDTVVEKNTLFELKAYMKVHLDVGIAGSRLMYYDSPEKVQALGGSYNKFWGVSRHITREKDLKYMDYVVGASMFVSTLFIEKIGLMCDSYFLYYEELDWRMRSRKNFNIACVLNSVVYHKEGASIGGGKDIWHKSYLSDYYSVRNRILFTKKYFKTYLFFVYIGLVYAIINRIKRRQFQRIIMILKLMIGK